MSDSSTRLAAAARRLATAPETLVTFAVLLSAWAGGATGLLPTVVWVVDFPALAVAFFLDTLAYNEFGVRENAVFYPALGVSLYLEALLVAAALRWVRRNRVHGLRRGSTE